MKDKLEKSCDKKKHRFFREECKAEDWETVYDQQLNIIDKCFPWGCNRKPKCPGCP